MPPCGPSLVPGTYQKMDLKEQKKAQIAKKEDFVQQNPPPPIFSPIFPCPSSRPVKDVHSEPLNFYWELCFHGDMTETELPFFRILSKKIFTDQNMKRSLNIAPKRRVLLSK